MSSGVRGTAVGTTGRVMPRKLTSSHQAGKLPALFPYLGRVMRLHPDQAKAIQKTIAQVDAEAEVFLFGSRVDDTRRGGDIDLLVMSTRISPDQRRKIKLRLLDLLGAQKIDLIVARDETRPFVRIARMQGIRL